MTNSVIRGLTILVGILALFLALRLWLDPADVAMQLGLIPQNLNGIATMRADVAGFFGTAGILTLLAAIRRDRDMLLAPAMLIGLALAGRIITFAFTEASFGAFPPMMIEAIILALFYKARETLDT